LDDTKTSLPKMLVVLNPKGGQADPVTLQQALDRNCRPEEWQVRVYRVKDGEDLGAEVRAAVRERYEVVAAAGGDGTVAAVANALIGTGVPLAILPVGTGNALARELALPLSLDRACALIAGEHQIRVIDVMQVGEHYCILNVSAGLSAISMRETTGESKQRYGMLAYILTALRGLAGFQARRYELEVDGLPISARASDVLVVNGSTPVASLRRTGPSLQLDDGMLGVYVIRARTLLDYLASVWVMLWRLEGRDRRVRVYDARATVKLDASPTAVLQADGDALGETPVTIKLVRQALNVIVPPPTFDPLAEAGAMIDRVRRQGGLRRSGG